MQNKDFWKNFRKYGFNFLTIFISVFAAFALNNWNENRKNNLAAEKILREIDNGLSQDLKDVKWNEDGHQRGIKAALYFQKLLFQKPTAPINQDSFPVYFVYLLRDFVTAQNTSGYQVLKSKGLELIKDDTLRKHIIELYENDYNNLRKFEEDYAETQFFKSHYHDIRNIFASLFKPNPNGGGEIKSPYYLPEKDKMILLLDLWNIQNNRQGILTNYKITGERIAALQKEIKKHLGKEQ